jgi:hypothetical protein
MFEGQTTIKFSKKAGMLIMSKNLSSMFGIPLEVTSMDMTYQGLEVTFESPQEQNTEEPEDKSEPEIKAKPEEWKEQ